MTAVGVNGEPPAVTSVTSSPAARVPRITTATTAILDHGQLHILSIPSTLNLLPTTHCEPPHWRACVDRHWHHDGVAPPVIRATSSPAGRTAPLQSKITAHYSLQQPIPYNTQLSCCVIASYGHTARRLKLTRDPILYAGAEPSRSPADALQHPDAPATRTLLVERLRAPRTMNLSMPGSPPRRLYASTSACPLDPLPFERIQHQVKQWFGLI